MVFDPRVPAGSDHYFHTCCPYVRTSVRTSVRPAQNFKIQRQSLPAGIVGWPSGSLMTPVLFFLISRYHSLICLLSHWWGDYQHLRDHPLPEEWQAGQLSRVGQKFHRSQPLTYCHEQLVEFRHLLQRRGFQTNIVQSLQHVVQAKEIHATWWV